MFQMYSYIIKYAQFKIHKIFIFSGILLRMTDNYHRLFFVLNKYIYMVIHVHIYKTNLGPISCHNDILC